MDGQPDKCCVGKNNSHSMKQSDSAELYSRSNNITRRDVTKLLSEYSSKFKWRINSPRVIDVGSADGSVTKILSSYLPKDYKILVGSDINERSVKFANNTYGSDRMTFIQLDIIRDVPNNLKNTFDNFFSFFTFQWIENQEKAYTNVYNLLSDDGECFVVFLAYSHIFSIFYALTKSPKWAKWMQDFDKFASPYWNYQDPEPVIINMLEDIGFKDVDVKCKQMVYNYENVETFKGLITAIYPFAIPTDSWNEFLDDFMNIVNTMELVDEHTGTVKINYNLLVIHCLK